MLFVRLQTRYLDCVTHAARVQLFKTAEFPRNKETNISINPGSSAKNKKQTIHPPHQWLQVLKRRATSDLDNDRHKHDAKLQWDYYTSRDKYSSRTWNRAGDIEENESRRLIYTSRDSGRVL